MSTTRFNDGWTVRRKVSGFTGLLGGAERIDVALPHDAMIAFDRSPDAIGGPVVGEMEALPPILRFAPETVEAMVDACTGRISGVPADALPGAAGLEGDLPPVHILVSEYDDLRPSGELLARQLAKAGIPVELRLEPGVLHGHLNRLPGAPGVNASLDWFADAIATASLRSK